MIPTMIMFGVLLGRWWKTSLILGTAAWTVLLWTQGLIETTPEVITAAGLALANTAVGVMVHQFALALFRRARGPSPTTVTAGH